MAANGTYPSAEEILAGSRSCRVHRDVVVPEWGGKTVPVCSLTGGEVALYKGFITDSRQQIKAARGGGGAQDIEFVIQQRMHQAMAQLCWLAMKNPVTNERIFKNRDQVEQLEHKGLLRVARVAEELNPLDDEAVVAAGKDSASTGSDSSGGEQPELMVASIPVSSSDDS